MIPVQQTEDNCLAAAVASIIECRQQDIPALPDGGGRWLKALNKHLNGIGWNLVLVAYKDEPKGYHLIIGEVKGGHHCIVGLNGKPHYDPAPSRQFKPQRLSRAYYGIIYRILL